MIAGERSPLQSGLTRQAVEKRLAAFGPNALPEAVAVSQWKRWLRQFKSPLIYILLFALVLDLSLWLWEGTGRLPAESIAIGLILVLNAALGAYQEGKAEEALARLKALAMPFVWVVRDGVLVQAPAKDLVPGDIARVEAGDRVPADGTLTLGQGVTADESILTGESLPIDKDLGEGLFSGTLVVRGKGYIEVTRTGAKSTMGRLAAMIGGIEASKTPLERRLGEFGNQVALAILALGLVLTIGGVVVEGIGRLGQVFLFSVALAVAAVPEGLPAVLTLTLALGVERLARRKAIVRRLSAVEALGSVTVIATDKTGTLTENRMYVRALDTTDLTRAMQAMVLANDAEIGTRAGDPLEVALLDHAASQGMDASHLIGSRPRVSSRPFDSAHKFMRVTVEENGRRVSYLKGAPEVLIARSTLDDAQKCDWEAKVIAHAKEGHRVVALAWRAEESEDAVTFLGLVLLWDPPRPEVPDALRRAKGAGIRVLMITGDHPATAEAVGRVIGISTDRVLTGQDIDRLSPQALREAARVVNVFARVSPEQKLRLIETLKDLGEIVAVTGDGVNDAPALKRSDVGVAMGQRGSDVSREVADVVLMDDNFATIVAAIEEGRNIYENIQKFIRFFFSTDLALILLMTAGLGMAFLLGIKDPAGGTFLLPLTAVQLLWINFVADGPPALAMALDRNPGVMDRPPRPPSAKLLDGASLRFVAVSAAAKALVGVAIIAALPQLGYSLEETRTSLFVYESVLQLVFAYPSRRIGLPPLPNVWIHLAVWLGIGLQALTLVVAPLRTLLGLVPIGGATFAAIMLAALLTWALAELPCRWASGVGRRQPNGAPRASHLRGRR
jgi:Ca2+-transporting ATPase